MVSINNMIHKMDKTKQSRWRDHFDWTFLEEFLHSAISSSHFWNKRSELKFCLNSFHFGQLWNSEK